MVVNWLYTALGKPCVSPDKSIFVRTATGPRLVPNRAHLSVLFPRSLVTERWDSSGIIRGILNGTGVRPSELIVHIAPIRRETSPSRGVSIMYRWTIP